MLRLSVILIIFVGETNPCAGLDSACASWYVTLLSGLWFAPIGTMRSLLSLVSSEVPFPHLVFVGIPESGAQPRMQGATEHLQGLMVPSWWARAKVPAPSLPAPATMRSSLSPYWREPLLPGAHPAGWERSVRACRRVTVMT